MHINSARAFGGGERHLADLAGGLHARGHEIYVALRPRAPLREELKHLPAENILELPLLNALDVASAVRLARAVRERGIEIIHAHVARDYPLAALAAGRNNARFVLTRHLERPLKRLHKLTARRTASVIAVSEAVRLSLLTQKIFPPEKIHHIPNGIDVARFEQTAQGFDREAFRAGLGAGRARFLVGITGELREHKGQEDFVRAARLVAENFADVHFVICGDDASPRKEYRAHLENLARELGLEGRVHFTGWLETVAPLLHSLDVFVSSSRVEPFGLVMVEAMACRLPVVATATGGAREIVEDKVTGRLVPVQDVRELARAVSELLVDEKMRRRMGESGHARAHERFSLERMTAATEEVYRQALLSK